LPSSAPKLHNGAGPTTRARHPWHAKWQHVVAFVAVELREAACGVDNVRNVLTGSEADKSTLQSEYCGRLVMFLKRLDGVSESSPWKISLFRN
jgi:hypothetical protein